MKPEDELTDENAERWIAECLRMGTMEVVGVSKDGEPTYRLTKAGTEHVEKCMPRPQPQDAWSCPHEVAAKVMAAVLEEREACAKIADHDDLSRNRHDFSSETARGIAARIRARRP